MPALGNMNCVLPPIKCDGEKVEDFEKRVVRHLELRITNISSMHEAIGWIATHPNVNNLDATYDYRAIVPYFFLSFDYLGHRMSIELVHNIIHAESWGFISIYPHNEARSEDVSE